MIFLKSLKEHIIVQKFAIRISERSKLRSILLIILKNLQERTFFVSLWYLRTHSFKFFGRLHFLIEIVTLFDGFNNKPIACKFVRKGNKIACLNQYRYSRLNGSYFHFTWNDVAKFVDIIHLFAKKKPHNQCHIYIISVKVGKEKRKIVIL